MRKTIKNCATKLSRMLSAAIGPVLESLKNLRTGELAVATAMPIMFERLEGRQLMSVAGSVTLVNGILDIVGSPTVGCNIYAEPASNNTITGSADNGHRITVPLSSVKGISITGGSGSDIIYVDTGVMVPVTINGGGGNDTIRGGGGYSAIYDGNGNNWINTRGTGDYVSVGNGNNYVMGGSGNDTILAGNGNDYLEGSLGNDSIIAGSGQDTLIGDAGNDTLSSGNGNDNISGGTDNDMLTAGTGMDTVNAGSGANTIVLNGNNTIIQAAPGTNTIKNNASGSISVSPTNSSAGSGSLTASTANQQSTNTTPNINWSTFAAGTPSSSTAPEAIMQLMAPVKMVGLSVAVNGLKSVLGTGTAIDADYFWNFGDSGSQYNLLHGFNANHVYTKAGTYTITLTVTNNKLQTSTVSSTVTIAPDTRRAIYVNANTGNDANNGSTSATAVKTAARADALIGNNTDVYFAAGQEFNLSGTFRIWASNVVVGSYGSGAQPILNYTAPAASSVIISADSPVTQGVTIQNLTFTTLNGTEPTLGDMPMGVKTGGYGVTVMGDTFNYLEYDVDANSLPVAMSVIDCSSPLENGLQGYFVWDQGSDNMIIGNTAVNSVHEHIVRSSGTTVQLIADNNFTNSDGKGCIEIHIGSYAWIQGNYAINGDIRVGPLGLWGESAASTTSNCVITGNTVYNSDIQVYPGAQHISINNNVINRSSAQMIDVIGQNSLGEQSEDIRIINNTGISTGSTGEFLKVENHVIGITLENNLQIEPNLATGGGAAAPVFVDEANLGSFTVISNNVWQQPKTIYQWGNGGINFVGTSYIPSGYLTAAEWNALPQVGTDLFSSTTISSSLVPATNSAAATAGTAVAGVFYDINGKAMPKSGKWSVGAIQTA